MSEDAWRDMIVGDRMRVDEEFSERIRESQFSNQEWGLIMTAAELRIEGDGESARIVADTSKVEQILPELEEIKREGPAMGGPPGSGGGGGLLDSIKSSLGLGGGGVDDETHRAAIDLVEEYAAALQAHLEEEGKWERVREASDQPSPE